MHKPVILKKYIYKRQKKIGENNIKIYTLLQTLKKYIKSSIATHNILICFKICSNGYNGNNARYRILLFIYYRKYTFITNRFILSVVSFKGISQNLFFLSNLL